MSIQKESLDFTQKIIWIIIIFFIVTLIPVVIQIIRGVGGDRNLEFLQDTSKIVGAVEDVFVFVQVENPDDTGVNVAVFRRVVDGLLVRAITSPGCDMKEGTIFELTLKRIRFSPNEIGSSVFIMKCPTRKE